MTETLWPVPDLNDAEVAFPANVLDWMPPRNEIPEEFRFMRGRLEWSEIVASWFFQGLPANVEFHPRPGVDAEKAFRAIQAILGSFAPKHEHKDEAAAFLLSQWFERVENWQRSDR
jgi:hypothetical protein